MKSILWLLACSPPALAQVPKSDAVTYPIPEDVPRMDFWVPDEPITAMAYSLENLYIAGAFTRVAPFTGNSAHVDRITGEVDLSWPAVDEEIFVSIPDGSGGWYIGGLFQQVDYESRKYLAHISVDGGLSAFDAQVGYHVHALALSGSTLFIGGKFAAVAGQTRQRLAAVDATTGALLPWDPTLGGNWSSSEHVYDLEVQGNVVFVGGDFDDTIQSSPRRHLAALDATTGALLPWNPSPDASVWTIEPVGNDLIVGGWFNSISGSPRSRIAIVNQQSGALSPLSISVNGGVFATALSGNTLYFGGLFSTVNGMARASAAAVDATSGALRRWDPKAGDPEGTDKPEVHAIALDGSSVWIGGNFRMLAGIPRVHLAATDANTGAASAWDAGASGRGRTQVTVVELDGTHLFVAGLFNCMGGEARAGLAAYDASTGTLLPWKPVLVPGSAVTKLAVGISVVYVGGFFDTVNGITSYSLAAVNRSDGNLLAGFQSPLGTHDTVRGLFLDGTALYVGGDFINLPPAPPNDNLRVVDCMTGSPMPGPWPYVGGGSPMTMWSAKDSTTLFIGGRFNEAGSLGNAHQYLAAFNQSTGALLPWIPNPNDRVHDLLRVGNSLFVGGAFTSMGGQTHESLVEFNLSTGLITPWNSWITNGGVDDIEGDALVLYVGGGFTKVGAQHQLGLAAFDRASGALLPWKPSPDTAVSQLEVGNGQLFVGGGFGEIAGRTHCHLAVFPLN